MVSMSAFTFLFLVVASCEGVPSQQQQIMPLIKLVGSREPASGIQVLAVFHFFRASSVFIHSLPVLDFAACCWKSYQTPGQSVVRPRQAMGTVSSAT